MAVKVSNVSNIAAFGAEWAGDAGTVYQLVNARGSSVLTMGAKPAATGVWQHMTVTSPERFGFTGPCKSAGELLKVAERFITSSEW